MSIAWHLLAFIVAVCLLVTVHEFGHFWVAKRLLKHLLRARQVKAGVSRRYRITAQIVGDTGPVVQAGSAKRVYGGLALLTLVAASLVWGFLGRRINARGPVIGNARSPADS